MLIEAIVMSRLCTSGFPRNRMPAVTRIANRTKMAMSPMTTSEVSRTTERTTTSIDRANTTAASAAPAMPSER